ncbi:MAG: hypothetical protein K1X44_03315 [Alphaproteobacteria bacterium]|nr:hypothetical protein [Alphaproteobacteria bacterium]
MKFWPYFITIKVVTSFFTYGVGRYLPILKTGQRQKVFNVSLKDLQNIILKDCHKIIGIKLDPEKIHLFNQINIKQSWVEYLKKDRYISYKLQNEPYYCCYEIEDNKIWYSKGYKINLYENKSNKRTTLILTQYIKAQNPFVRILCHLFYYPHITLDKYLSNLSSKLINF